MKFKDFYSKQAAEYSKYRPTYPEELFHYLSSISLNHDIALDCATGNGQAAKGLTPYFKKVIALDASEAQIKNALRVKGIEYKIAKVENTGIISKSIDLLTVATAIHWIDIDLFYEEARRVLSDHGIIAIWTYSTTSEINSEIDKLINSFSNNSLHEHWDKNIKKVWYFDELNFPFKQFNTPQFEIRRKWTCDDYLNYMFTWSSVQKYIEVHNSNPIDLIRDKLKNVWGYSVREITWEIKMKAGKLE